jgi:hypothetical protein
MVAGKNRLTQRFLLSLSLVVFLFNGRVFADSTPSASAELNWTAITFSGAVAPAQISADFNWTTLVQAQGDALFGGASSNDWTTPLAASAQPFALALANSASLSTSVSIINNNTISYALAERTGSIAAPNGNIEIDVPYSLQITNDFGYDSFTEIQVALATTNGDFFSVNEALLLDPLGVNGNMEQEGVFPFVVSGLSPGTYFFDVAAQTEMIVIPNSAPEPSGLFLLCVGLLCLIGMSLWERFAQFWPTAHR